MNIQAELTITWLENGQIKVSGCINNEMVSLFILDKGRDAIKAHCAKLAEKPMITPARFIGFPQNGERG